VFDTDEYRAATSTPWRNRIIDSVKRRERRIVKLLKTFARPEWGQP
jgi:hypothetical protein